MFGDMAKMMKQVAEMKAKMGEVDKELKNLNLKGISRDGSVEVEISGKMILKRVGIADSIVGDKKKLEKSVFEAVENALKQATETAASKLSTVTGGMKIPGIN